MNVPNEQHQRKLRQLAKEYAKRGYRVEIEAEHPSLPLFLAGRRFDLVAYGPDENVVVEIAAQRELTSGPALEELAAIVKQQKGWRLELVVMNPKPGVVDETASPLTKSEVATRIANAERLLAGRDSEAAFLLAWTAIEAQLRGMTHESDLHVSSGSGTGQLIKKLFTLGVFNREDYCSLMEALEQRNAVIHGFHSGQVYAWAQRMIALAERMMAWKSLTEQSS